MNRKRRSIGLVAAGVLSLLALAQGPQALAQGAGSDRPYYPPVIQPAQPDGPWGSDFRAWPFSFRYGYGPGYGYRFYYKVWYGEDHPYGYRTWYGYGMPYYVYYPRPYLATLDAARERPAATAVMLEPGPGEGLASAEEVLRRVQTAWLEGSTEPLRPVLSREALVGLTVAGRPGAGERLSQNEFLQLLRRAFETARTERLEVAALQPRGADRLEATAVHDYRGSSSTSLVAAAESPSAATVTVIATCRRGRWFLTALTVPEGHPLVAPAARIASR
jgi:hypothetical protein